MKHAREVGWWEGSITGSDNETMDPTFMCVMFAVFILTPLVILALIGVAIVDVYFNHHDASVAGLGGGIAAVIGSVAAFVLCMSQILKQDKMNNSGAPPPAVQTTTQTTTTTATDAKP